jgi:hypothetical protein
MSNQSYQALKNIVQSKTNLVAGLFGAHGIGKTSLVRQLADDLKTPLLIMNLAAIEPSDFSGRCIVDGENKTTWAKPKFLDFEGFIFLDEINRVHDLSVKACLNSLLLDKSINGHALNPKTKIIVAGNIGENYETTDFDSSLKSRIISINYEPSLDDWKMRENETNPSQLVDFIASVPSLVSSFDFRRLTEANLFYTSAKTHIGLEYILNHSLVDLFNESLHKDNLKFSDVLDNNLEKIYTTNQVRLTMLAHESAQFILSQRGTKENIVSIRNFILKIGNESKLTFFTDIKTASDSMPSENFKPIAESLNAANFFGGELKQYLKVIFDRE